MDKKTVWIDIVDQAVLVQMAAIVVLIGLLFEMVKKWILA